MVHDDREGGEIRDPGGPGRVVWLTRTRAGGPGHEPRGTDHSSPSDEGRATLFSLAAQGVSDDLGSESVFGSPENSCEGRR